MVETVCQQGYEIGLIIERSDDQGIIELSTKLCAILNIDEELHNDFFIGLKCAILERLIKIGYYR